MFLQLLTGDNVYSDSFQIFLMKTYMFGHLADSPVPCLLGSGREYQWEIKQNKKSLTVGYLYQHGFIHQWG
jgi:hypothetical protein